MQNKMRNVQWATQDKIPVGKIQNLLNAGVCFPKISLQSKKNVFKLGRLTPQPLKLGLPLEKKPPGLNIIPALVLCIRTSHVLNITFHSLLAKKYSRWLRRTILQSTRIISKLWTSLRFQTVPLNAIQWWRSSMSFNTYIRTLKIRPG